jgi:hypothetical protein
VVREALLRDDRHRGKCVRRQQVRRGARRLRMVIAVLLVTGRLPPVSIGRVPRRRRRRWRGGPRFPLSWLATGIAGGPSPGRRPAPCSRGVVGPTSRAATAIPRVPPQDLPPHPSGATPQTPQKIPKLARAQATGLAPSRASGSATTRTWRSRRGTAAASPAAPRSSAGSSKNSGPARSATPAVQQ